MAGVQPARAEAEAGSPKWVADQFKQLGLKPMAGSHGYLTALRARADRSPAVQIAGVLAGADPLLSKDYVLVSARLDSAGEAALIQTARALARAPVPMRRSIVFVLSDADGAQRRAAAPNERMVADLDLDVAAEPAGLALTAADETSLGGDASELALSADLPAIRVAADERSYGDLASGVPTLSIRLGAEPAGMDRVSAYLAALVARVAMRDARPAWSPGSRFAPPAPRAEEVLTNPVDMPLGRRPRRTHEAFG